HLRLGARHGSRMARHQRDTEQDGRHSAPHWVRTATFVDPCVTPPASLNRTKIRLVAGANATVLVPVTKMPKVGVSFVLMVVTTGLVVGTVGFTHCPVMGSVRHRAMRTGRFAAPVSAETVIVPPAPRFTVATAKTPVPVIPGILTIPSFFRVALMAT